MPCAGAADGESNERRAYCSGVFRFPKRRAAGIAAATVSKELKKQTL